MNAYNRVTCVGYNTGKLIIGSCHIPRPRKMYPDEFLIQELLINKRMPAKRVFRDAVRRTAVWVSKGIAKLVKIAQGLRK